MNFRAHAFIVPAYLLNLMFLWTTHVLSHVPHLAWELLWSPFEVTLILLAESLHVSGYFIIDATALLLAVFLFFTLRMVLKSWRDCAMVLLLDVCVFESELYLFDRGEFWLHVTGLQAVWHVGAWFSNADLLLCASGLSLALWLAEPHVRQALLEHLP